MPGHKGNLEELGRKRATVRREKANHSQHKSTHHWRIMSLATGFILNSE